MYAPSEHLSVATFHVSSELYNQRIAWVDLNVDAESFICAVHIVGEGVGESVETQVESVQMPKQSALVLQAESAGQREQLPPQSTSDSSPSLMLLLQLAWGVGVGEGVAGVGVGAGLG